MSTRKQVFTNEFERRLLELNNYICYYFKTGHENSLFPALFKVFSLIWTSARVRLSSPRYSDSIRVFSLENENFRFEVEPVSSSNVVEDDSDLPF